MKIVEFFLVGLIKAYRLLLSPYLPATCRYAPTCSAYGVEAIRRHGPLGGLWLALRRVARCHPWGGSGYDPVPETSPFDGLRQGRPGKAARSSAISWEHSE